MVSDIKRNATEMDSEPIGDDIPPARVSKKMEEPLPQSTMASSGLFSDPEDSASDLEQPYHPIHSEEVRDDDEPLIVFEDTDQQEGEEAEVHGGVVLETESSDAAGFQSSDHEQSSDTGRSIDTSDDDELPIVSTLTEHSRHVSEQDDPHESDMEEAELSEAEASHTSDSDVPVMQLPAVTIRGPFLNTSQREHPTETGPVVSPEMVLCGLIRDAQPEMIHFTWPHSLFSPNDLLNGLQYAHSMLQAATSKLAILALLSDYTTNMSATDLRRWIALVDNSNPQTRTESRMTVIFESLSVGEMKAALEELVQSRLVVEGELGETRWSLLEMMVAKERQERHATPSVKTTVGLDDKTEHGTNERLVSADDDMAFDTFVTAVMVVLIGALYSCVRD